MINQIKKSMMKDAAKSSLDESSYMKKPDTSRKQSPSRGALNQKHLPLIATGDPANYRTDMRKSIQNKPVWEILTSNIPFHK